MAWIEKTCNEAVCGLVSGVAERFFDITLFSPDEVIEIGDLKTLVESVL